MTRGLRISVAQHASRVPLLVIAAIAALVSIGQPRPACAAATIVVDTAADEDIANTACSLREAIIAANTNASYNGCAASGAEVGDMIVFDLENPTITVAGTPLPAIAESVTIDGGPQRVELHGPGPPRVSGRHGLIVSHDGFGTTIRNLVVNNFADDGIYIDADEVSVVGCFIGTDAGGTMPMPNQGFGVHVFGGNGTHIGGATSGGPCTGDCNVISGAIASNANVLLDDNASGAVVRGNFIGTDVTGTAAIPNNTLDGVRDRGTGDRIGGTNGTTPGGACTGDCNLVSGNMVRGIIVDPPASNTMVRGNYVGTDVTGALAVGNQIGIESYPAGVLIGGTTPEARNVVSGNGTGVQVRGTSPSVQGNYIGTNSAGTAAVPGSGNGILLYQADGATIGGTMSAAGNLLSGNSIGVVIDASANTQITGNLIGTAADGSTALPNALGVLIVDQASKNTVGGPSAGAANTIAFSTAEGVRVDGVSPQVHGNAIRGNSIYSNAAAGIHLINNGNDALAPPTIVGIAPLHGTSCAPCVVDVYSDAEDEGRVFEGSVQTNDGNWTFNGALSGPHVTATNTDMTGNTSQFSAPFSVTTATATPTPTGSPTSSPTAVPTLTITPTTIATQTPTATASHTATPAPTHTATPTSSLPSATNTATTTVAPSFTLTPAQSAAATPTSTASPLATPSPTSTISTGPTSTATVPSPLCVGDCDGRLTVTVDELITLVNITLGGAPSSACAHGVPDGAAVDIALIIQAVNNALGGCAGSA